MKELYGALERMKLRIAEILAPCRPSVYLYGSVVLNDFRRGWSDIDILVLTEEKISREQARQLVGLRQTMLAEEPENRYYRSFEGAMLTLNAFLFGEKDRVVYWGTSGERITDRYRFDAFCLSELHSSGALLYGKDVRDKLPRPAFADLRAEVQRHYETIRQYAQKTERNFYSFGWLLDISRCIYTLRTGKIIAKTTAGEWARREGLCPCADALDKAVAVRKDPERYQEDLGILDYAETLGESVQKYADVLERELLRSGDASSITEQLLGKCGFCCACCPTCIKGGCRGCIEEHQKGDCYTRDCVLKQGLPCCGACERFPCEVILTQPHATVLDREWLRWKKESGTNR